MQQPAEPSVRTQVSARVRTVGQMPHLPGGPPDHAETHPSGPDRGLCRAGLCGARRLRRGQDLLLDFPWRPRRCGLDLLPAGCRTLGCRYGQYRQYLVLLGRCRRPAGSDPLCHRRRRRRHRDHEPRSRQPGRCHRRGERRRHSGDQLQHIRRRGGLPCLCRQRPFHRRPALGPVSGRQRPCRSRRLRLASG